MELTNHCNLNCVFCPRKYMEKERGYLSLALAKILLDEIAGHAPVSLVPFFRGESLLHPEWDAILAYAKERRTGPVQMATNASLLTSERAERLLDIGIDFLSFSMDTVDPLLYRKLRGADYEKSLGNIMYFLKERAKRNAPVDVQVSAVETADNKEEMENFVAFWKPKVDRVRIYIEHSSDGAPGSLAHAPFPRSERKPCHKVFEDMVIYWNGDAALCNHDWTRLVSGRRIGNVCESGIGAVWNSPEYRRIREAHNSACLDGVSPCEGCDHWATGYTPAGYWGRVIG